MLKDITKEQIDELAELIEDSEVSVRDIAKSQKLHMQSFNALIIEHLFAKDSNKIKDAILKRLLGDSITRKALEVASVPQERVSYKTIILSELPKLDKRLLEKLGYEDFIEKVDADAIILKVEETKTIEPPDVRILIQLLKGLDRETVQKIAITPFPPPHPSLPPV